MKSLESGAFMPVTGKDTGQARLSMSNVQLIDDFTKPGNMLVLTFPLTIEGDNSALSVTPYKADFNSPSDIVRFVPDVSALIIDGYEYELPESLKDQMQSLGISLDWFMYHQVDDDDGEVTVTVYLELHPDSVKQLGEIPEIELDAADFPTEWIMNHVIPHPYPDPKAKNNPDAKKDGNIRVDTGDGNVYCDEDCNISRFENDHICNEENSDISDMVSDVSEISDIGYMEIELITNYSFVIPLYVEQRAK
jgi:hypothetical protein